MRVGKFFHDKGAGARRLCAVFETGARASRMCRRFLAGQRRSGLELGALVCISILVLQPASAVWASPAGQSAPGDRLEPGLQGQTMPEDLKSDTLQQPYSKGVRLVGHADIWNRGSNLQLAWIDSCAYVSSTKPIGGLPSIGENKAANGSKAGVAVIDVSDPRAPKPVRVLRDRGAINAVETMHAVAAPGRKVLVAGAYAGGKPGAAPEDAAWLDIYDASDCKSPKLMNEFKWPENVHMVTVSSNGRHVYGTSIDPFTGRGGLLVLDISDLAHPRFIGKFGATRQDGTTYEFATHEVSLSPDERRIYAGVIASKGGDLNRDITTRGPSAEGLGPNAGGIYILDNSDIVDGRSNPQIRLIGTALHGGWHSVVQANINGVPYLVGAGELGACPASWPKIVNIADETKPYIESEFKLQMNQKENCPPRTKTEMATNGIVGSPGTAATHFNDVDSATNTLLGLFPFTYAGLRIVDLHDPAKPVEVGYFKPGDSCMSHVHYVSNTGQIWFACAYSGFYVIELKPELRAFLGLPQVPHKKSTLPKPSKEARP